MKDHLGNVRMTFTSKEQTDIYTANFESSANTDFENYSRTTFDLVDHTDAAGTTYDKVQYLNGGVNGRVGVGKSFAVMPGDEVTISAYCKYMNLSGTSNANALISSLANAFGVSSGSTGKALKLYNGLNSFASLVAGGDHSNDDEGAPKLFATIVFFDENYKLVDAAWKQVTTTGAQTSGSVKQPPHDFMTQTATAKVKGYAYMFLSNEHPTYVDAYFDDVSVSYTPSPVVQMDDYYPFGLRYNSYVREDNVVNKKVLFQGQEHVDDLGLEWDSFKWRNHQPDIGRFFNVDPLSEKYYHNSPYAFSENKVTAHIELEGLEALPALKREINKVEAAVNELGNNIKEGFESVVNFFAESVNQHPEEVTSARAVNETQTDPQATDTKWFGDREVEFNPNSTGKNGTDGQTLVTDGGMRDTKNGSNAYVNLKEVKNTKDSADIITAPKFDTVYINSGWVKEEQGNGKGKINSNTVYVIKNKQDTVAKASFIGEKKIHGQIPKKTN